MRARKLFFFLATLIAAGPFLPSEPRWICWCVAIAALILLRMLWINLLKPLSAIDSGMHLIDEQDFASSLVPVGQPDADRLVAMFNRMISQLRDERVKLNSQQHFLALLTEVSPMGVMVLGFDERITLANPAVTAMLGGGDFAGRGLTDLPGTLGAEMAALAGGETRTLRSGNGSIYRISRLSFMDSGFARPFLLVESLTLEVARAEKNAYEKVIRMLAHEVNNSLAGVLTLLGTLRSIHAGDPDIIDALTSCDSRIRSLGDFISAYASVLKVPPPHFDSVNLRPRLESWLPFFRSIAPDNVEITLNGPDVRVRADLTQLQQVLVNIVKNSIESIGSQRARIELSLLDNPPRIVISDSGPGISDAAARELFSPFFSTKSGGRGLGLMLVSEILQRHGATFSLRTDPDDALTRFTITFPQ